MLADLTHGTGRYSASQGIVATVQGVSVAISNAVVGLIVVRAGYDVAFVSLGATALIALLVFLFIAPETRAESVLDAGTRGAPSNAGPRRQLLP
jgi:sugar phosphate permease